MRMILLAAALAAACCCACVPQRVGVELEHVSHPTAGWPLEPQQGSEDALTHVQALAQWDHGGAYLALGLGVKVQGENGGGFYGPALTGSVRAGYMWTLRGPMK